MRHPDMILDPRQLLEAAAFLTRHTRDSVELAMSDTLLIVESDGNTGAFDLDGTRLDIGPRTLAAIEIDRTTTIETDELEAQALRTIQRAAQGTHSAADLAAVVYEALAKLGKGHG